LKSRVPSWSSRALIWRDTDDGASPMARPAAEKLPVSATLLKSFIPVSVSMRTPSNRSELDFAFYA
jgi:hypothetical protein